MDNSTKKKTGKDRSNVVWSDDDEALLVHKLKVAKEEKLWGDNNPKDKAWTFCVEALAGSEKVSGGAAKDSKALKRRWQRVRVH
jgi:hypothetical protein